MRLIVDRDRGAQVAPLFLSSGFVPSKNRRTSCSGIEVARGFASGGFFAPLLADACDIKSAREPSPSSSISFDLGFEPFHRLFWSKTATLGGQSVDGRRGSNSARLNRRPCRGLSRNHVSMDGLTAAGLDPDTMQ
jgi:hypothetical protein